MTCRRGGFGQRDFAGSAAVGCLASKGLVVGALLVAAASSEALACGGGGVTSVADSVVADAQRIVIASRGTTTDMVVQINVPAADSDYGVLIPVPSEPTLDPDPVSEQDLRALDEATAPTIRIEEPSSDDSGPIIGCGSAKSGGDSAAVVTASEPVEIGPVTAVSITGESAEAVSAWLSENDFVLPTDGTAVLDRYVGQGSYFIALKRNDTATPQGPTSLGVHYVLQGNHRMLSLGFTRLGAAESVAFTVFVVGQTALGPSAPFAALTLNDLDDDLLRQHPVAGTEAADPYRNALETAVRQHESQAFVLESATSGRALNLGNGQLGQILAGDVVVTRASTVIEREHLELDVVFNTPVEGDVQGTRLVFAQNTITDHNPALANRPAFQYSGFVGLGVAAVVLRRRGRRRGGVC